MACCFWGLRVSGEDQPLKILSPMTQQVPTDLGSSRSIAAQGFDGVLPGGGGPRGQLAAPKKQLQHGKKNNIRDDAFYRIFGTQIVHTFRHFNKRVLVSALPVLGSPLCRPPVRIESECCQRMRRVTGCIRLALGLSALPFCFSVGLWSARTFWPEALTIFKRISDAPPPKPLSRAEFLVPSSTE